MPVSDAPNPGHERDQSESHNTTSGATLDWAANTVSDIYHSARAAMPVKDEYKDIALAGVAIVGSAATAQLLLKKSLLAAPVQLAARAEGVKIVPLTADNLPQAVSAAKDGFSYGWPVLNPGKDFKASLNPVLNARISTDPKIEMNSRYWLAVDKNNNVLGTTGLYESARDKSEAAWLGWMSVRGAYRGQGIGKMLLEHSAQQAKADGKQYLRLYTSTSKGEAAAQGLYESQGFKLVGREPHSLPRILQRLGGEKNTLEILFREKKL